MRKIVLATSNPGKLKEIREVLAGFDIEVLGLSEFDNLTEPVEDGDTFAENARKKAIGYSQQTSMWCLADDSGLAVDALGGAPGVYSARYAADRCEENSPRKVIDAANNEKLLEELKDTPGSQRTARFVCSLALADGEKIIAETFGTIEGVIGHEEAGENGFGYDPLFFLPEKNCTTAQLAPSDKNSISHRGKALVKLTELLKDL